MTNFKELDKRVNEGLLRKVVSPCGKLCLYNYTDHCTYEKKWDEYTLNARGTVYERSTGKVIARAFPKFFNYEELPTSKSRNLFKRRDFEVFEKADGSLGIIFHYCGRWWVNTRGSFTSDQAVEGLKILDQYNMPQVNTKLTLLCEIIYPENRIIMDYGDERKLVLLSAYYEDIEMGYDALQLLSHMANMPIVKKYYFKSIEDLIKKQETLPQMEEGFVVRFKDGYRVKFKSKEYLKLARVVFNVNPLEFWKNMKNGKVDSEMLELLPEELRDRTDKIAYELETSYSKVKDRITEECVPLINEAKNDKNPRKYIGLRLNTLTYKQAIFVLYDNKEEQLDEIIMKIIRPKGNEYFITP